MWPNRNKGLRPALVSPTPLDERPEIINHLRNLGCDYLADRLANVFTSEDYCGE